MEIPIYSALLRSLMLCVYLFLINFMKGGYIKCYIFLIGKGNKIIFTHIIVVYIGKQHVES